MPRQKRTARQILLYFIGFYTVGTLLLGLGAYMLGERALTRQLDDRITAEAGLLRHIQKQSGIEGVQAALARRDDRGVNALGYLLLDKGGRKLGGELGIAQPSLGWHTIQFRDLDEEINDARSLTTRLDDGSVLTVAAETEPTEKLRGTFLLLFLPGFAIMLWGGLAGGLLFGRAIRAHLKDMNDTAVAIIGGDMDQRIPVNDQGDEFSRLAITLNHMLDRNGKLIVNLRQVSSDIAHDLRTPIAHLRQRLERAAKLAGVDDPVGGEIERAIDDANAILSLFAALLRISEVESGVLKQYFRAFEFSRTVTTVCESYVPAAEDRGHCLIYQIEDGIWLHGDSELIAQALINLLENGLRHTPAGTIIEVGLCVLAGEIQLSVTDNGPGVAVADLPILTQRFTRLDRARAAPGYGLGLNLVEAIVRAHEGKLGLKDRQPGFGAYLTFPQMKG